MGAASAALAARRGAQPIPYNPAMSCRLVTVAMLGAALLLPASACDSPQARRERLASLNPLERVQATVQLAEAGDTQAVYRLVDLLEDADPAVRMYAILALQRLCGTTLGYQYYAAQADRAEAVRRWRQALREGRVLVRFGRTSRTEPADPRVRAPVGTSLSTQEQREPGP